MAGTRYRKASEGISPRCAAKCLAKAFGEIVAFDLSPHNADRAGPFHIQAHGCIAVLIKPLTHVAEQSNENGPAGSNLKDAHTANPLGSALSDAAPELGRISRAGSAPCRHLSREAPALLA